MPHSGDELGADLVDLWEAGLYELKPVAQQFKVAADRLMLVDGVSSNWYRHGSLGGPYGLAKGPFEELVDAFFEVLRTTAENLDLTGDAMVIAAEEYASTDTAAETKFKELQRPVAVAHAEDGGPR